MSRVRLGEQDTFTRFARVLSMWILLIGFAAAQVSEGVVGNWSGTIETPGAPLEVVVTLELSEGILSSTIDIPAQGAQDLPLENVSAEGAQVNFAIHGAPGAPTFEGQLEGDAIRGTFSQAGQEFPFTLGREVTGMTAVQPAAAGTYEDPQGRFSLPIPTNWTVEEEDGFITLSDPGGDIQVYVLTLEEGDPKAAIAQAWRQVDANFALEPSDVQMPPSEAGVEETVITTYETDDRVCQEIGQLYNGKVYTLLFNGELAAVQRRAAQLNIIATGFEIAGLEQAVLTDVKPRAVNQEVITGLETFIEDALSEFGIPGAAVAVVQNGEIVYTGGFGVREVGENIPITPDTHMIGSTGKSMTTMLMASLVDTGEMTWNTPVREVLTEFAVADPELTETMTMRNLVCACTGVPRRDLELIFNADELTAENIVESLRTFEFFTDFGEAFQYSNQLVGTGGYAAAAAAGADYGDLFRGYETSLQERILDPIGMTSTTLSFETVEAAGDAATPHTLALSGAYTPIPLDLEQLLKPIAPAGSH